MGKGKVTILEPAIEEVARISLYIEGEGLPTTAKRFVDDAFVFFESLSDERIIHRPCKQPAAISYIQGLINPQSYSPQSVNSLSR